MLAEGATAGDIKAYIKALNAYMTRARPWARRTQAKVDSAEEELQGMSDTLAERGETEATLSKWTNAVDGRVVRGC